MSQDQDLGAYIIDWLQNAPGKCDNTNKPQIRKRLIRWIVSWMDEDGTVHLRMAPDRQKALEMLCGKKGTMTRTDIFLSGTPKDWTMTNIVAVPT